MGIWSRVRFFNTKLKMKKILLILCVLSMWGAKAQDSLEIQKLGHLPYSGKDLNDIWGYAVNGREYALVGTTKGLSIVEVTNPSQPFEKHFVTGATSTWRDIKTWGHYAYVVHDNFSGTSDGIMIVNLNTIDSSNLDVQHFHPDLVINGQFFSYEKAHNLFVDENGVLYIFGANVGAGGAIMYDVDTDPENPILLGVVNRNYYHDGMAQGDTLWTGAVYDGEFEVFDVSNKANPVLLARQGTPFSFTHNVWVSEDNKTLFTTDEKRGAPVASYDVSDLNNIKKLDEIRTSIYNPDSVIPHNVHVKGDFLVTSYYTSGLQIVDASVPDILVETAYYDTSPLKGDGYRGAWGAYPYLPSGNILVTDIEEGLFILQTSYPRATYLDVKVRDSVTGNVIIGATVDFIQGPVSGATDVFGKYSYGQRDTGTYTMVITAPGYFNDTLVVKMERGVISSFDIAMLPLNFSVAEQQMRDFELYPNPSRGFVSVVMPGLEDPEVSIKIYDISGRIQFEQLSEAGNGRVEVNHKLPAGVYLVKVSNGDEVLQAQRMVVAP